MKPRIRFLAVPGSVNKDVAYRICFGTMNKRWHKGHNQLVEAVLAHFWSSTFDYSLNRPELGRWKETGRPQPKRRGVVADLLAWERPEGCPVLLDDISEPLRDLHERRVDTQAGRGVPGVFP